MANYEYKLITEEIINNAGIPPADVFDYKDSPIQAVFARYFQFCQENLTERNNEFDIQPAKFYFRTQLSVNASAGLTPTNYYIVRVNMGTLVKLYDLFYEKNSIFDEAEELSAYELLNKNLDAPLGYLMFQLSSLFTYYHELAHLIQKSPTLPLWIDESYILPEGGNYNADSHVKEFDADLNGAHLICFHLIEYWKKQKPELRTQESFQMLLSIGGASILSYFLLLPNADRDIYYKDFTHPHPFVRIAYIVDCFIKVAEINLPEEMQVNLNATQITSESFKIADNFFKRVLNNDKIQTFGAVFLTESANIKTYVTELIELSKADITLVRNRIPDKIKI